MPPRRLARQSAKYTLAGLTASEADSGMFGQFIGNTRQIVHNRTMIIARYFDSTYADNFEENEALWSLFGPLLKSIESRLE